MYYGMAYLSSRLGREGEGSAGVVAHQGLPHPQHHLPKHLPLLFADWVCCVDHKRVLCWHQLPFQRAQSVNWCRECSKAQKRDPEKTQLIRSNLWSLRGMSQPGQGQVLSCECSWLVLHNTRSIVPCDQLEIKRQLQVAPSTYNRRSLSSCLHAIFGLVLQGTNQERLHDSTVGSQCISCSSNPRCDLIA